MLRSASSLKSGSIGEIMRSLESKRGELYRSIWKSQMPSSGPGETTLETFQCNNFLIFFPPPGSFFILAQIFFLVVSKNSISTAEMIVNLILRSRKRNNCTADHCHLLFTLSGPKRESMTTKETNFSSTVNMIIITLVEKLCSG